MTANEARVIVNCYEHLHKTMQVFSKAPSQLKIECNRILDAIDFADRVGWSQDSMPRKVLIDIINEVKRGCDKCTTS